MESRSYDPLKVLQARTAAAVGADFFQALASAFAEAFEMRHGMLARTHRGRLDVMETLALWDGKGFAPTTILDLANSPCLESVAQGVARQLGAGARARFPGHAFFVEQGIESYICVPVVGRDGEVVGVLSACDPGRRPEIAGFAECVRPFADRAAWLIERLELEERLRREADRAAALAEVAGIFQRTDMASGTFDDVCAVVRAVLGADGVALRILDLEGRDYVLRGSARMPPEWGDQIRTPLSELEATGLTGEPVSSFGLREMARFPGAERVLAECELRSGVVAWARHEDRIVGFVTAYSEQAERRWDPEDRRWLAALSGMIVQAFVNARLVEALRASEGGFRSIVTTALEGVLTLDAEHRVTFANPQAGEMFGCSAEALVGRPVLGLVAPSHHAAAVERLAALREGQRQRFEALLACPAGQERWVVLSATPTFEARRTAGATVLLADVTESRALADRVAHLRKLESLGVLAGGIAHDFNNILLTILGNLGLAREQLPRGAPVQVFLDEIEGAGQRAAALTRQILTFAGRSLPRVRRIDLGRLVAEARGELRRAVARDHAIEVIVAPNVYVDADPEQIRQVLDSLVINASEAIGERSGMIVVEVAPRPGDAPAELEPGGRAAPGSAALIVRDEGHGIDAGIRPRIFDPFFSTRFTGRGLGLSTALGIVRSHRGSIGVESTVGVGSTFTVLLPLASGPRTPPPRPVPVVRKILVVDDDPTVLSVSCHVLERAGFTVVRASDGRSAVSRFAADRDGFSAVLLDITMPGIGGFASLHELRRLREDVPIVLTSGYEEQDVMRDLDVDVPSGFIQKPWTAEALVQAIRGAIEG